MKWSPSATVAAVIEQNDRFLIVEEETFDGIRLNQPAGHLEPFETLVDGAAREALEETARHFTPQGFLGIYMSRYRSLRRQVDVTYLRFAFVGQAGERIADQALDEGILKAEFLTLDEIVARQDEHRSPLVMRCIEDYLSVKSGKRALLPLDSCFSHPSAIVPGWVDQHDPDVLRAAGRLP